MKVADKRRNSIAQYQGLTGVAGIPEFIEI